MQIFATDIDDTALSVARQGIYQGSFINELSPQRLKRFFVKIGEDQYRVSQHLRDCLVFASQSLINDAPFSNLDLISCRNFLIYLLPEMQAKVIQLFHFALKDHGYLLLGPSESIGRQTDLFTVLSKKWRLFERAFISRRRLVDIPISTTPVKRHLGTDQAIAILPSTREATASLGLLTTNLLLREYAPASVLINKHYEILQFFGPTVNFLELPSGEPTRDLMSMLRDGLSSRVRSIAHRAWSEQVVVVDSNARVKRNDHYIACKLIARPVDDTLSSNQLLLISFEDTEPGHSYNEDKSAAVEQLGDVKIVEQLEYELKAAREDLQINLADFEGTNEELKAANEEMMSMNEELQSANEELETSKEELQSMNEELNTVNAELQGKVEQLELSHDDVINLLASSDIATLFLDRDLHIKLFNPATMQLLNVRNSDIDRPISDFSGRVDNADFTADAQQVLNKLALVERVVDGLGDTSARHYLRRMVPYRSSHDRIGGVVVTYVDITERYQFEKELERQVEERSAQLTKKRQQLSLVLHAAGAAVWEMDANKKRQLIWDDVYRDLLGEQPPSITDTWDWWLRNLHPDDRQRVESSLLAAIAGEDGRWEEQYRFSIADNKYHWMSDVAYISRDNKGNVITIDGAMVDIEQRKQISIALYDREQLLSAIMNSALEAFVVMAGNGNILESNPASEQIFHYSPEHLQNINIKRLLPYAFQGAGEKDLASYWLTSASGLLNHRVEVVGQRKDGSLFPVDVFLTEISTLGLFVVVIRDLTHSKRIEKEVSDISTWEQEQTGRELHDGLGQRLTGVTLLAHHVKTLCGKEHGAEAEILDEIITQLKEAALEVSRISHGLAPISIAPDGLADALRRLVEPFQNAAGVNCQFICSVNFAINDQAAANQIYRIAQEAFNNALKYAHAKNIILNLVCSDDIMELTIEDDGCGFDLQDLMEHDGLGTRIMRYRASSVGASLVFDTAPGEGTKIQCVYRYQGIPDSD